MPADLAPSRSSRYSVSDGAEPIGRRCTRDRSGAEAGAPKYMEWYGAFGLVVTLVWLYLEILRLLAKLQSRD